MHLITGGAGFLGSHLVDELVLRGDEVRVLDAFTRRPNDDDRRKRRHIDRWKDRVEVVEGDVRDPECVRRSLEGVRRVYHLAHFVGSRLSVTASEACVDVNVQGTRVLLDCMRQAEIESMVLVSSGAVYGECREGARETDRLDPRTPFAASMVAAEALCNVWHTSEHGHATVVRPFNVFGPRMRPDSVIRSFLEAAHRERPLALIGSGTTRRDHVYAADVVDVLLQARRVPRAPQPMIFNACRGLSTSLLELVDLAGIDAPSPPKLEFLPAVRGDVEAMRGDPTHTERVLGCRARISLERGIEQTRAWLETKQFFTA